MKLKTGFLGLSTCFFIVGIMDQPLLAQEIETKAVDQFEMPDVKVLQKQIDDLKARVDQLNKGTVFVGGNPIKDTVNNSPLLTWNPGPILTSADKKFSFRMSGRITYDYASVSFKDENGVTRPNEKINGVSLRHLETGFRGKMFGDFNYRVAVKFVNNEVDIKLAYVDYNFGNTQIVVGQTRTYNTLDKLTPPHNHAFAERASFINSIRINPRVGVGVSHHGNDWSVSGGYFFENANSTNNSVDDNNMASARINFSPKFDNGIGLHFAGSTFYRNENGNAFRS